MKTAFVSLLGVFALSFLSCKASVSADAKVGGEAKADFDKPLDQPVDAQQADFDEGDEREFALLGARHDLTFKGNASPKCKCLAVALGVANDSAFEWATGAPRINPEGQLVVALSSVACGDGAAGASYWGFETDGADVVVVVENAHAGRPLTSGGIIPRPMGDGNVYVRPKDKKVPYGGALDGGGRCKLDQPDPVPSSSVNAEPKEQPKNKGVRIGGEEAEPTDRLESEFSDE